MYRENDYRHKLYEDITDRIRTEICTACGGIGFIVCEVTVNQKVCKISEKCFYCDGYGARPRKTKLES
jgi:hypothetical protein